jgi:hypothetical protein
LASFLSFSAVLVFELRTSHLLGIEPLHQFLFGHP